MFGLSVWELVIIAVVALLVLGPERLPKMAKQLGRGMREFRKSASELQHSFEEAAWAADDEARRQKRVTPEIKPALGTEAQAAVEPSTNVHVAPPATPEELS